MSYKLKCLVDGPKDAPLFKVLVITLGVFCNPVFSQDKKLSPQSQKLSRSIASLTQAEHDFLRSFPKNKSEFIKICHSSKLDELYDCNRVFYPHVERLVNSGSYEMGKILANLASSVDYDADAPNYLQDVWQKFCVRNPRAFVKAVESLKNLQSQKNAIKYLNEYLHHPDNQKIVACISALEEVGQSKWVEIAKGFLHKEKKHK